MLQWGVEIMKGSKEQNRNRTGVGSVCVQCAGRLGCFGNKAELLSGSELYNKKRKKHTILV